jgi:type I restriction enzyme S subunit
MFVYKGELAMPKKKTALTIEERLQQALVPAEEQPYEVPENWVWVYGKNIFMPMESRKPDGEDFYYIDIDAIDNKNQVVTEAKKIKTAQAPSRASRKLHTGDTVFSLVRPYLKNIAYIDVQLSDCIASTGFFVCTPNATLNDRYLYRLMVSSYVVDGLNKYMKGDNSPSIRKDDIENYPFPLPPLSEQQRIVERIEELFAKLDEAKERLQEAADSFAVRKAAILHKAFTGELTKQWRLENGVSDESWEESNFGKFTVSQYGYTEKAHWEKIGPKFLRITDIQDNKVDWDEVPWCPIDEDGMKQYAVEIGDIMIARTGATTGKSYLICDDVEAVFASFLIRLKVVNKNLDYNYLYGYMQSEDYWRQITDFSSGIAQPGVNASKLKQIKFKCPTLPEQHEIVRLINDLLARERSAQQAAEQAK